MTLVEKLAVMMGVCVRWRSLPAVMWFLAEVMVLFGCGTRLASMGLVEKLATMQGRTAA
nr:hypothetical protein [Nonomuraea sp. SYSU D8015]